MAKAPDFDLQAAHRYFSVHCFNQAWNLIDKAERTPEEDEAMLHLNLVSQWHWSQREDCTAQNISIGYWQTTRIQTLLGQVEQARYYGGLCLAASQEEGVTAFCLGYAYEALARAEALAGNEVGMRDYLNKAEAVAETVDDLEDKELLLADLATISPKG